MSKTITELNPQTRRWISSEQVVAIIDELLKKYEIPEKKTRVIPRLVLHITLKIVESQTLTQTLAEELNVSLEKAVAIANEIKEKIFLPVRKYLFDDDIDINLIKTTLPGAGMDHKPAIEYKKPELAAQAPAGAAPGEPVVIKTKPAAITAPEKEAAVPAREEIIPKPPESVVAAPAGESQVRPLPAAQAAPAEKTAAPAGGEPAPFVLHQEKGAEVQPILTTRKVAFTPAPSGETRKEARPVAARLEIGEEAGAPAGQVTAPAPAVKAETPQQRVVHYSEFRTPVSPFGQTQNPPSAVPSSPAGEIQPVSAPLFPQVPPPEQSGGQTLPQKQAAEKTPASEEVVDLAAFRKEQKVTVNKNTVDLR